MIYYIKKEEALNIRIACVKMLILLDYYDKHRVIHGKLHMASQTIIFSEIFGAFKLPILFFIVDTYKSLYSQC